MAIFPHLQTEATVQINDCTRLDASRSFISIGEAAITKIEIQPEATGTFVDVTTLKYLDWQYATAADKVATVRITTTATPVAVTATATANIAAVTAATDALFSSDNDLLCHEPGILSYLRDGRNTFLDMHRRAQTLVLKWLDQKGYRDDAGVRLTKVAVTDSEEVNLWATYIALRLIFDGLSNAIDDIFAAKALSYGGLESQARDRAFLSLDTNGDGKANSLDQEVRLSTVKVIRR